MRVRRFRLSRIHLIPAVVVMACFSLAFAANFNADLFLKFNYLFIYIPFLLLVSGVILACVLAAIVVGLLGRAGRKPLPAFAKASWGAALGLALSIVMTLAPSWLAQRGLPLGPEFARFDPVRWQNPAASGGGTGKSERQKMLKHLVAGVLPGKSEEELVELLGPSLQTPYFSERDRDLIYLLGPQQGLFGVDSEWLLIWVDDSGHFERCEIVND